jgi:hypothetical protein
VNIVEVGDTVKELTAVGVVCAGFLWMLKVLVNRIAAAVEKVPDLIAAQVAAMQEHERRSNEAMQAHEKRSSAEHQALLTAAGQHGDACSTHKDAMTFVIDRLKAQAE